MRALRSASCSRPPGSGSPWSSSARPPRCPSSAPSRSSAQCAECHAGVYGEWQASWHAQAWTDPEVRQLSNDFANTDCIDCHAPRPVFETGLGEPRPAAQHAPRRGRRLHRLPPLARRAHRGHGRRAQEPLPGRGAARAPGARVLRRLPRPARHRAAMAGDPLRRARAGLPELRRLPHALPRRRLRRGPRPHHARRPRPRARAERGRAARSRRGRSLPGRGRERRAPATTTPPTSAPRLGRLLAAVDHGEHRGRRHARGVAPAAPLPQPLPPRGGPGEHRAARAARRSACGSTTRPPRPAWR